MSQHDNFDPNSLDTLFGKVSAEKSPETVQRNPFKFLDPYTLEDHDLFFGRDHEITQIYSKFYNDSLLLVYGESGSGKTSLIQCGLQAEIPSEEALFISIRSDAAIDSVTNTLRKVLHKLLKTSLEIDNIEELLEETYYQKSKTLVLVLDQFEEFFLSYPKSERKHFAQQLSRWLQNKTYLRVIISIREEYYARLTELEEQLPELFKNRLWVRRMTREQTREVISKPCEVCRIEIEEPLIDKLLNDLTVDNKEVDLPTLQVVLDSLYDQAKKIDPETPKISLKDYDELGKTDNILANFIQKRLETHDNSEALRQVLKAMITAQGTRKISTLEDIQQRLSSFGPERDRQALSEILQQLSNDRIIREDTDNGFYELRHDSLANTIAKWMTGEEKELIEIRQDINNRYKEYLKRKTLLDTNFIKILSPHEAHLCLNKKQLAFINRSRRYNRRKSQRHMSIIIMILSVVLVAVSLFGYEAEQAKKKAINERKKAIDIINYMNIDLRDKLVDKISLSGMEEMQQHIIEYFNGIELDENDFDSLKQKSISMTYYADTLLKQGKIQQAKSLYMKANKYLKKITTENPENNTSYYNLSVSYEKLGSMYLKERKLKKAQKMFDYSLSISLNLININPNDKNWQHHHLVILSKIAKIYIKNEKYTKALENYNTMLSINKKLFSKNPEKIKWRSNLAVISNKIGDIYIKINNKDKALELYRNALDIQKELVSIEPNNSRFKIDISISFNKLGDIYLDEKKNNKALKEYRKALFIRDDLAHRSPENRLWQRALSVSFSKLGDVFSKKKNKEKAVEWYSKGFRIIEKLSSKKYKNNLQYDLDKAEYYYKLSCFFDKKEKEYIKGAEKILNKLKKKNKLSKSIEKYFDKIILDTNQQCVSLRKGW